MQEGDENSMMTRKEIERINAEYPLGSHVILIEMKGEPQMPYGLKGTVMSIDDIGQLHVNWENGSTLALTEEDSFTKIEMVKVIVCRPGEKATLEEIDDSLESMQSVVGGHIEEYQPFHDDNDPRVDDVAIFCNEEGKLNRLPPSRAIAGEDGQLLDIIVGPFFICYAPIASETIQSLPEDLEQRFKDKFKLPEHFFRTKNGIKAVKYDPGFQGKEHDMAR